MLMGHCRASLIKPKQMREIIEPRASRTMKAMAAGGFLNSAAVKSPAAGFSVPPASPPEGLAISHKSSS
jgi:hypothetical protein